jgi:hypothetical protein
MKFCFIVPYYSEQSNGIRVLYKAALLFSQHTKGCCLQVHDPKSGKIISNPDLRKIPYKFQHLVLKKLEFSMHSYYVLPETPAKIPKNLPKNAKIVRYLLANPFFLNKEKVNLKNQFLLSYSYAISDRLPQLFIESLPVLKKQNKTNNNKKLLIYFGKFRLGQSFDRISQLNKVIKDFSQVEIIHRGKPKNHKEYLKKLNKADCLISYDGLTSVIREASLVGIPVLVVDDLLVKKKFNIKLSNIYTLNILANKKKLFLKFKTSNIKHELAPEPNLSKIVNLIGDFFSNNNKLLSNLFNQEIKKMEQFSKKNFSHDILSFNSDFKLFFLLLFLFDHKAYSKITISLNKIKRNFFKILLTLFFSIYHLRIQCFPFGLMFIKYLILYKLQPKRFIMHLNNYISMKV